MLIDFKAGLKDIHGEPMTEETKPGVTSPVTLGVICTNALLATFPDEQNLTGQEKVKRFRLAEKASQYLPVDIGVDDVTLIKQLIGKAYGPLIVGRAYDLIEPPAKPVAEGQ